MDILKVGTRKSKLALQQTDLVIKALMEHHPDLKYEIIPIQTKGDQIHHKPLREITDEGKSAFTSELEKALRTGKIDIAVHSMKDVAGNIRLSDLKFAAFLERQSPEDVLITNQKYSSIEALPEGFVIGTVSLRRRAAILRMNNAVKVRNLRGNVQTRVDKLKDTHKWSGHTKIDYDGIIMAKAAIERSGNKLDLKGLNTLTIPVEQMIPAAGQGVIGVQCRAGDGRIIKLFSKINHKITEKLVRTEREFLYELSGNCHTVIGVYCCMQKSDIKLIAEISEEDGKNRFHIEQKGKDESLGVKAAKEIRKNIVTQKGVEFLMKNLNLSLKNG